MPWLSKAGLERIRELEQRLLESVPRADYDKALARIADLEKRVDWQADMLLRRGGSLPLPQKSEAPPTEAQPATPDEADVARAQAIVDEGRRLNLQQDEILAGVRDAVPSISTWSGQDIARMISPNGRGVS